MLRYLIFPEEQQNRSPNPLEDYTLAGTTLLPANFGSIAPVNIFLGENNSGKSRFMREIMRDGALRVVSLHAEQKEAASGRNKIEKGLPIEWKAFFVLWNWIAW